MRLFLITIMIIFMSGIITWLNNQAHDVGSDVSKSKLNSLSFAPFRKGQDPLKGIFPDPEEINEDLSLMADITHFIRSYSSTRSMETIPAQAEKYGLKMIQGAWLGYDKKKNKEEIDALIKSANQYPNVVKRVIVGNEVLLRGEMEPEHLIKYIREVKTSVKQPVSYADVWSMYMKYPQLIREVDFITIHILPYWEDEPVAVEDAPGHIERAYKIVQAEVERMTPGKIVFIGETGWPGRGRQRGLAEPSVINQATFIRELIKTANKNGFDYNLIEAFNQPWKSQLEGVVGGHWGLFSAERQQVFPLTGPVMENSGWYWSWLLASLLVLVMLTIYRKRLQNLCVKNLLILVSFAQLLSIILFISMDELWQTSYSLEQQTKVLFIVIISVLMAGLIISQVYKKLIGSNTVNLSASLLYGFYCLFVVFAILDTYELASYGRYLSFPYFMYAIPIMGILGNVLISCLTERRCSLKTMHLGQMLYNPFETTILNKVLGFSLICISMALIYGETRAFMYGRDFIVSYPEFSERLVTALSYTLSNKQLLIWLLCLLILAIVFLSLKKRDTEL